VSNVGSDSSTVSFEQERRHHPGIARALLALTLLAAVYPALIAIRMLAGGGVLAVMFGAFDVLFRVVAIVLGPAFVGFLLSGLGLRLAWSRPAISVVLGLLGFCVSACWTGVLLWYFSDNGGIWFG
jgi:uncharacterized membrane protein